MAEVVGGFLHTRNAPNYVGPLLHGSPEDTPLLAMLGGLNQATDVNSTVFTWQSDDLPAPAQPSIIEGQAPPVKMITRSEITQVVQIFQYGFSVTYSKEAAVQQLGVPIAGGTAAGGWLGGTQPITSEISYQADRQMVRARRDVEYTIWNGTYANPTDNATARKMRGLLAAITTNATAAAAAPLDKVMIDGMAKKLADAGAPWENMVLFVGSLDKMRLSGIYGYAPESRTVGGVHVNVIETDFGILNIKYDRWVPAGTAVFLDMTHLGLKMLSIPGKGHFFLEELAHTGAAWNWQLYGEIGISYGLENFHGKITGLAVV